MGTAAEGGGDLWATFIGDRFTGPGGGSCKRPLDKVSQGTGCQGTGCQGTGSQGTGCQGMTVRQHLQQLCVTNVLRYMHT